MSQHGDIHSQTLGNSENCHQSQNSPYLFEAMQRSDVYTVRIEGDLNMGHSQTVCMLC